ncbi:SCP2 sterol-binding domain-containing protein [Cryptosporangium phraense]|uniref:SCP2 sterol-binding domain-containing protein n=1 Tax=Cryptosporangium phraense TaxID=2593070 RepID=A0A545AU92_9ACTN|nr:SCP2 sterol-binding domain-containing protein [Cryptosporangium phraense]TQS44910.1 SCP2 sterol-binding domain-containing protein [Cryptosporangium phraense]
MSLAEIDPKKISVEEFEALLASASEENLDDVDPAAFARLIGRARRDQLDAVMKSPLRTAVLDQILRRFAEHYRAGQPRARKVIHWKVTGGPDGSTDEFELVLHGDRCDVNASPEHEADTTIILGGPEFLLLTSGNGKPTTMFMTGKLKVRGDLGLAAVLAKIFEIPG